MNTTSDGKIVSPSSVQDICNPIDIFTKLGLSNQIQFCGDWKLARLKKEGFVEITLLEAARKINPTAQGGEYGESSIFSIKFDPRSFEYITRQRDPRDDFIAVGQLNNLNVPIPHSVASVLLELTESKMFDGFRVLAPVKCFNSAPAGLDPVIVGYIDFTDKWSVSHRKYFFVAKWD